MLVALCVTTSSVSFAATNPTTDNGQDLTAAPATITFAQIKNSMIDVVVVNPHHENLTIRLTDYVGKIIAVKKLNKEDTSTRIRFNLTNLTDGVYYVRTGQGNATQLKKFEIKTAVQTSAYYQEVTLI